MYPAKKGEVELEFSAGRKAGKRMQSTGATREALDDLPMFMSSLEAVFIVHFNF